MTQSEVDRQVARVTGESMRTVRRHGFSILPVPLGQYDEEPEVATIRMVDWDEQDLIRRRAA